MTKALDKRSKEMVKQTRSKPVVDVNAWDEKLIRDVIYNMYETKQHITLDSLLQTLADREDFKGSRSSLWRIIRQIGFKNRKDDPRRGLLEIPQIALKRIDFFRKFMQLKNEDIYQNRIGGTRYIVLHAGSYSGFVTGAELVFASKSLDVDYHGEMNQDNFLRWFENQLLVNLYEPSVIKDNASYHSTVLRKVPTTASKKGDIQEWLSNTNIQDDAGMFKTELPKLVQVHKPPPMYVAEMLAEKYGHKVLSLPPYHCMFNAIEYVWGITKNYYRDHLGSTGSSIEQSLAMWREALNQITSEVWKKTIQHSTNEIQKWWNREVVFERDM